MSLGGRRIDVPGAFAQFLTGVGVGIDEASEQELRRLISVRRFRDVGDRGKLDAAIESLRAEVASRTEERDNNTDPQQTSTAMVHFFENSTRSRGSLAVSRRRFLLGGGFLFPTPFRPVLTHALGHRLAGFVAHLGTASPFGDLLSGCRLWRTSAPARRLRRLAALEELYGLSDSVAFLYQDVQGATHSVSHTTDSNMAETAKS